MSQNGASEMKSEKTNLQIVKDVRVFIKKKNPIHILMLKK